MPRRTSPSFIHTFELNHLAKGMGSLHDLQVSADFYRKVYNAVLGELYSTAKRMKDSVEWNEVRKFPRKTDEQRKDRSKAFEGIKQNYGLTKNDAEKFAKTLVKNSSDFQFWTNSAVVQKIAARAMKAVDRFVFAKAKRVRFKCKRDAFSFEGKSNNTGVRIIEEKGRFICVIGKMKFAMTYDIYDEYDVHALSSRCKYARILCKTIKGRKRFFVQGIFEGLPFANDERKKKHREHVLAKCGANYFEEKKFLPLTVKETVSYDIGPKNIAVSTPLISFERPLCGGVNTKQQKIRRLQRYLDRSRRATCPQNYEKNGAAKKGRKKWTYSRSYIEARTDLADIERRKTAERKSSHGNLCNEILAFGTRIHTEKVSIKGWQKRWGRSIAHHSPSALTSELTRKAEYARGRLEKISTYDTALSQHCVCGHRKKKKLSERIHSCEVCGFVAKRDSLAAYLAIFCENRIEGEDKSAWWVNFDRAREFLKGHRTLSLNDQHCVLRVTRSS